MLYILAMSEYNENLFFDNFNQKIYSKGAMREVAIPKKLIIAVFAILAIVACALGFIAYNEHQKTKAADPQNELASLVSEISQFTELPAEQPTLATVTDKEKLKQYPFFSKAEIGDKVLIFNQAKKAYLYRPLTKKLIEVGPIQLSDQTATQSATLAEATNSATPSATQKDLTLSILNGTKTGGLAAKTEAQLKDSVKNIQVKTKGNAKNDYEKTVIVAVNSNAKPKADELAKALNAKVEANLPEGETKPATDLVVFLGTDRI